MNIIFFGSSEFAIPSLKALLGSSHRVLALVTQPDRKKGRNLRVSPPPTKVLASSRGIPVYQPEDVSCRESVQYLKGFKADLFVVISFGQILKKAVLAVPRLYSINLHGSILPKYRGAAPINWAVIKGDSATGATVIRMNEIMDAGDIILNRDIEIAEDDTSLTMSEKISDLGAELILESLAAIEGNTAGFAKQDERGVTYAPKLKKEDGLIDWRAGAASIHDRVRGLIPWPGAYTRYKGRTLKIFGTLPPGKCAVSFGDDTSPGEVVDTIKNKGILVKTGCGHLIITHLQLEGRKILDADAFLRGHRIEKGTVFS